LGKNEKTWEDKITNIIAFLIAIFIVFFLWIGLPYIASQDEREEKKDRKEEIKQSQKTESKTELTIDEALSRQFPWDDGKSKDDDEKTSANYIDELMPKYKQHLTYAINYLKTTKDNESEKNKARRDIELINEYIEKATYLRGFYDENGIQRTDEEYEQYISKNMGDSKTQVWEDIKEKSSNIDGGFKKASAQVLRGIAKAEYLTILLKINMKDSGIEVGKALDDNVKNMKDGLLNIDNEVKQRENKYIND
jgi:hypothetical protein